MSLIERALNKSSTEIRSGSPESLPSEPNPESLIASRPRARQTWLLRAALVAVLGAAVVVLLLLLQAINEGERPERAAITASPQPAPAPSPQSPSPPASAAAAPVAHIVIAAADAPSRIPSSAASPPAVSEPPVEVAKAKAQAQHSAPLASTLTVTPRSSEPKKFAQVRGGSATTTAHSSPADPSPPDLLASDSAADTLASLEALLSQAYISGQHGQYDEAIRCYDLVLERDPGNFDSLLNRGIIRQQTGDTSGAERDLTAALAENPTDSFLLTALGALARLSGDPEKARRYFTRAGDATALTNLALLYWEERDFDRVLPTLQNAAQKDSANPFILYYIGLFYRQLGNPALSGDYLERAVTLARKHGEHDLIRRIETMGCVRQGTNLTGP